MLSYRGYSPSRQQRGEEPHLRDGPEEAEKEQEDYMTMALEPFELGPSAPPETSLQRRVRKRKEGEARGRFKSKSELVADETARREERLSRNLLREPGAKNSKAFIMMQRMGYDVSHPHDEPRKGESPGEQCGRYTSKIVTERPVSAVEPIHIRVKGNRAGIGHYTKRKRDSPETLPALSQSDSQRAKSLEEDFRTRRCRDDEATRGEELLRAAQRVAESLYQQDRGPVQDVHAREQGPGENKAGHQAWPPLLKDIPVQWRGLLREREEQERLVRAGRYLDVSLSNSARRPLLGDCDVYECDEDVKYANHAVASGATEDSMEDDLELAEFNALDPRRRLDSLVMFLRKSYRYCFWCKHRYPDKEMDGCPGMTEAVHD